MSAPRPQPLTLETIVKRCGVLGTLEGKVSRIVKSQDGSRTWAFELSVTVTNPNNGASWEKVYTVWDGDADKYNLGDHVIVTGDVTWKYETYRLDGEDFDREVVKGSVNNPHVKPAFTTDKEPF